MSLHQPISSNNSMTVQRGNASSINVQFKPVRRFFGYRLTVVGRLINILIWILWICMKHITDERKGKLLGPINFCSWDIVIKSTTRLAWSSYTQRAISRNGQSSVKDSSKKETSDDLRFMPSYVAKWMIKQRK